MPEKYQSYDRESIKAGFKKEFGDMLEKGQLQGMLGKQKGCYKKPNNSDKNYFLERLLNSF